MKCQSLSRTLKVTETFMCLSNIQHWIQDFYQQNFDISEMNCPDSELELNILLKCLKINKTKSFIISKHRCFPNYVTHLTDNNYLNNSTHIHDV